MVHSDDICYGPVRWLVLVLVWAGWCWFFVREKHCWLAGLGWLKPTSEQAIIVIVSKKASTHISLSYLCGGQSEELFRACPCRQLAGQATISSPYNSNWTPGNRQFCLGTQPNRP